MRRAAVGLGNPGRRFAETRHNVGYDVVETLAGSRRWSPLSTALACVYRTSSCELVLIKPTTFMNDSGQAVFDVLHRWNMTLRDIFVVVDDTNLPVGRIRVRRNGSDGGHNGLRSIINRVGGGFPRLRIGVGGPQAQTQQIDHVLGKFSCEERSVMAEAREMAIAAILHWCSEGVETTMNRVNGADPSPQDRGSVI